MLKKLQVPLVLMSALACAGASTTSIGTVTARGDLRVDSYNVNGNATLFNGSVVETGHSQADLHLGKGTDIKMDQESRGTMYSDHLVLQQGTTELTASSAFNIEASGVQVAPIGSAAHGVISVAGNSVQVAALSGTFGVANAQGMMVAKVHPGQPLRFSLMSGNATNAFSAHGTVSFLKGSYYLTTSSDATYQLTGSNLAKFVGKSVAASGTVLSPTSLSVSSMTSDGAAGAQSGMVAGGTMGMFSSEIAGLLITLGAAGLSTILAVALSQINQPSSPK